MISKYFLGTSVLILNILLFSSCLNSSDNTLMDRPTDPQIYAISLASRGDTLGLLSDVSFTIDQVNNEIFNKEPLPYLFSVDSVMLRLSGSSNYYAFNKVEITLEKDSTSEEDPTYAWNSSDSIPLARLKRIKTTSPDNINTKDYSFKLNIYTSDPYIISWERVTENHLTPPIESQRTITYGNNFYTYYRSGSEMKAYTAPISENPQWTEVTTLTGMPNNIRLSSLITSGNAVYGLTTSGSVLRSTNATTWSSVSTSSDVKAIYGDLPFAAPGNILLAVNDGGTLKFAKANETFSQIQLMNNMPDNMPVIDFSVLKVESSTVYARKFIFVAGGKKTDNTPVNDDIWVLQEADGEITYFISKKPADVIMDGSSLFFYDDQPYLIGTLSTGKNILMHSRNYGAEWSKAGENQAFPTEPDDFTGRKHASVITDTNNNIWIFGGISSSNSTQLRDIWKGRLNKFTQD